MDRIRERFIAGSGSHGDASLRVAYVRTITHPGTKPLFTAMNSLIMWAMKRLSLGIPAFWGPLGSFSTRKGRMTYDASITSSGRNRRWMRQWSTHPIICRKGNTEFIMEISNVAEVVEAMVLAYSRLVDIKVISPRTPASLMKSITTPGNNPSRYGL